MTIYDLPENWTYTDITAVEDAYVVAGCKHCRINNVYYLLALRDEKITTLFKKKTEHYCHWRFIDGKAQLGVGKHSFLDVDLDYYKQEKINVSAPSIERIPHAKTKNIFVIAGYELYKSQDVIRIFIPTLPPILKSTAIMVAINLNSRQVFALDMCKLLEIHPSDAINYLAAISPGEMTCAILFQNLPKVIVIDLP